VVEGLAHDGGGPDVHRHCAREPTAQAAGREPRRDALESPAGTLELLKFRVTDPEPTVPESIHGAVITALNEEAVASAALANKGGST
jgi:hypothetical protein